jgi:hypothetical protein
MSSVARWAVVIAMALLVGLARVPPAAAETREEIIREAAKHFERGVALYGEADYRGALVEFKRAAQLAPNPTVLYNIGQTQYQLREYAEALATFQRYLAEAAPSAANRAEVEGTIEVLKSRVGRLTIVTDPPGADIFIDDAPVGRTPFDGSLAVSVGRLKVMAVLAGRPSATRYVDVAAGDEASVVLQLAPPTAAASPVSQVLPSLDVTTRTPAGGGSSGWRTAGWIVTGVAAAGAVGFGILAKRESDDLATARNSYPVTATDLNHRAHVTTGLAIAADSLAALAVVIGGVTLYSTLSGPRGESGSTRVSAGLGTLAFETTF